MKKTINYLFAALTLIAAASCTKDIQPNEQNDGQSELRTIELSFEDSCITKVGVSERTPQWEAGDKIWLSNGTTSEEVTLASEDITANVAKISTSLSGTLYAVYPASAQNGVSEGKIGFKIPTSTDGAFGNAHIAVAEGTTSLTFKNVVSILKITTEDATKLVNISSASAIAGEFKVTYSGLNVEVGTNQAKSINITSSVAGEKYVAVASGVAFNALEFTAVKTATNWAYKKSSQETPLDINTMYDIGAVSGWNYTTTNSLLWAKFSVDDDKQVRFTKGNLYYSTTGSAFHLESAQNVTYATLGQSAYTVDHVCHFFWSKTATVAYAEEYSDSEASTEDAFFCGEANPMTVDYQSGLYALSNAEWCYLLNYGPDGLEPDVLEFKTDGNVRQGQFKYGVEVNGATNCLVIAPDGYTGSIESLYNAEEWATAEALGLVCLPAAGYREGSNLTYGGSDGRYWSATPNGSYEYRAYGLRFGGSDVSPSNNNNRNYGNLVRLVYSVSE